MQTVERNSLRKHTSSLPPTSWGVSSFLTAHQHIIGYSVPTSWTTELNLEGNISEGADHIPGHVILHWEGFAKQVSCSLK